MANQHFRKARYDIHLDTDWVIYRLVLDNRPRRPIQHDKYNQGSPPSSPSEMAFDMAFFAGLESFCKPHCEEYI